LQEKGGTLTLQRNLLQRGTTVQGSSQFRLLAERRFGPFFGVQFLGAFNDNVFRQALVILLAYQTASFTTMSSNTLQNLAQALFISRRCSSAGCNRPSSRLGPR
jgi:hypothetical protein